MDETCLVKKRRRFGSCVCVGGLAQGPQQCLDISEEAGTHDPPEPSVILTSVEEVVDALVLPQCRKVQIINQSIQTVLQGAQTHKQLHHIQQGMGSNPHSKSSATQTVV